MITGISHLTFIVEDLERASRFWREVFDAEPVYDSGEQQFSLGAERFFIAGGTWICIMQGAERRQSAERGDERYDHTAFHVSEADFDGHLARIEALGLRVRPGRPRVPGEGRSVYFYDYDGHLFELHTGTLAERLARYAL